MNSPSFFDKADSFVGRLFRFLPPLFRKMIAFFFHALEDGEEHLPFFFYGSEEEE